MKWSSRSFRKHLGVKFNNDKNTNVINVKESQLNLLYYPMQPATKTVLGCNISFREGLNSNDFSKPSKDQHFVEYTIITIL